MAEIDLTRRRFLAVAGGALLAPGAARAARAGRSLGAPVRAMHFAMSLPGAPATASARRRHVTDVIAAPARFDLLGLRWRPRKRPRIELRTRRRGGLWSDWLALSLTGDHAPDGRSAAPGTEPAWTGGADEFQLRFDRSVAGIRAHFINSTGTTTAAGRARASARRSVASAKRWLAQTGGSVAAGAKPTIISRSEWGGRSVPPKRSPEYGRVKFAFVHHTVGTNNYGPEDSAAIVLAIAKYHRNVNGWNDIGYNFLADKYGQIFEGRAGGIKRAVIGAQARGYNSVSTSIANLGTFSTAEQSKAGLNACAALIAWKLGLHSVPVNGTVFTNGKKFQRISGHRDANSTACPGDALYGQLPRIRSLAASGPGPAGPAGSLALASAKPRFIAGEAIAISGTLVRADGSTPAGARVEIQVQRGDGYRTLRRVRTGSDGSWSVKLRRASSARLRARHRDDTQGRHIFSRSKKIVVAPAVTANANRKRVRVGQRVVLSGRIKPAKRRVTAVVERRGRDGRFSRVAIRRARARRGRFRLSVRLTNSGLYRITIRTASDPRNGTGKAPPVAVRVGGGR